MRALVLPVLLASACAAPTASMTSSAAAPPSLPNIDVESLDGAPTQLKQALGARPTLVSLWATWCETCLTELGALGRLSEKAAEKGAYVVAVSEGEARATVVEFVKARGLKYPQLIDEKFALADAIGQRSVPATLVVDREGRIVHRGAALDEAALRALDRAIAASR